MTGERKLIGRSSSLFSRDAVWQVPDGLEVETSDQYDITRRQVLFQDIFFVTHHRMFGVGYLVATGLISLFFVGIAMLVIGIGGADEWVAALVILGIGMPAILSFLLRLLFRLDVITIYGKRSKASIRFRLRKQRARQVYAQICATVRNAQTHMARAIEAEEAAQAPTILIEELPPMPPEEPELGPSP